MTRLYLLRHGETEENTRHILQGTMPGTLTALGRQQALDAAAPLAGLRFDAVFTSDLRRCVETTRILLPRLTTRPGLRPVETKLLRERDWGSVTGMVVDGQHKVVIPPDAESVETMKRRARAFLQFVATHCPGQTVLAVSHGLFCRCLQAVHAGAEIADIPRMANAETRLIEVED